MKVIDRMFGIDPSLYTAENRTYNFYRDAGNFAIAGTGALVVGTVAYISGFNPHQNPAEYCVMATGLAESILGVIAANDAAIRLKPDQSQGQS